MANNEQIDNTSYYRLPSGKYLEDFIAHKKLNFAEDSALKYKWRAGKKDGEDESKDMQKFMHYCKFRADDIKQPLSAVRLFIENLCAEASAWDGNTELDKVYDPMNEEQTIHDWMHSGDRWMFKRDIVSTKNERYKAGETMEIDYLAGLTNAQRGFCLVDVCLKGDRTIPLEGFLRLAKLRFIAPVRV